MNTIRLYIVILMAIFLNGCGGGEKEIQIQTPPKEIVISGVVSDELVEGATITAASLDTGLTLGTAVTDNKGVYSIVTTAPQIGSGYILSSKGGKINGLSFTGNMSAIYTSQARSDQANLTLLTSALVGAANSTQIYSGTQLQKHEALKIDAISRGLINSDYWAVEPSGTLTIGMRAEAKLSDLDTAIKQIQLILENKYISGNCLANECTASVGSTGGAIHMVHENATVDADAGVLRNCVIVSRYDAVSRTLSVHVENQANPVSTAPFRCEVTGRVKISMPQMKSPLSSCVRSEKLLTSTANCVTRESDIQPGFFVTDEGEYHRTDQNSHMANLKLGNIVKLSQNYGSSLSASMKPTEATQWFGKTPVILVHGFTPRDKFGGDNDTWGSLPRLIMQDSNIVLLNFQWITDASYISVSRDLAKAVKYASSMTGKKVNIVAHSFGGVLSRTMLQNLAQEPEIAAAASLVSTLATLGTPHSGINNGDPAEVEGVLLPDGWGSLPIEKWTCHQISCYESGLNAGIANWTKDYLRKLSDGSLPKPGYINARLSKTNEYNFPSGLKILTLIGQVIDYRLSKFKDEDGLITYSGQRFDVSSGNTSPVMLDKPISGATVTERVLGLKKGQAAQPGTSTAGVELSNYARGFTGNVNGGYKHSSWLATLATGGFGYANVSNSEVFIPEECGSASSCEHDGWKSVKEFWASNPAMCVLPLVLKNQTCVTPPSDGLTITGFVRDEHGEPIIDASVGLVIAGIPNYTKSDASGAYYIHLDADSMKMSPDVFVVNAYQATSYNPSSVSIRRPGTNAIRVDFSLLSILGNPQLLSIELVPDVHHLGDGSFAGVQNSQFQYPVAEGLEFVKKFEVGLHQKSFFKANLIFSAKGVQCSDVVSINNQNWTLSSSDSSGSYSVYSVQFDPAILSVGLNIFRMRSSYCSVDYDDFEFTDAHIVFE